MIAEQIYEEQFILFFSDICSGILRNSEKDFFSPILDFFDWRKLLKTKSDF